ncbi:MULTISPECIES: hypothetical protein [Pedobacter]|nr:hypothetical protein [Pedobacter aquatilis]
MNFLPFKAFELSTSLSPIQVKERIISNTLVVKQEHFKQYKRLFKGSVSENSFKISRVLSYSNGFKADIFGVVEITETETLVKINMKLKPLVSIFLIMWCSFVGFALLVILIAAINDSKIILGCLFPLNMLAFAYGLAKISFNSDAKTVKKILIEILEAREQA